MWENIKSIIYRLFNKNIDISDDDAQAKASYDAEYADTSTINITAIIANKLATLTVDDSDITVFGNNKRAEYLNQIIKKTWLTYGIKAVSFAFGVGKSALIPYATGGKLYVNVVPQSLFYITGSQGDEITAVCVIADSLKKENGTYYRYTDYSVENGVYVIRQRATRDGTLIDLDSVPEWSQIAPELRISGIDRLPIGFIKCPANNRKSGSMTGVPITYGCGENIKRIKDTLSDIAREFKLKEAFVGADSTLFDKDNKPPKNGLFKKFLAESRDGKSFWEVFDPAIRDSSYFNRLQNEFALLEKSIGVSRGILTEPETNGATATEIRRANHDTYAVVDSMRSQIESAFETLAYAFDAFANLYNITPAGEYSIKFDWGYSLIEDSSETFSQLAQGKSMGAVKTVEIRQYLFPAETPEQARDAVEEIARTEPNMSTLIGN